MILTEFFDTRQECWKYFFRYEDGNLYWRACLSNRIQIGAKAGYLTNTGYVRVTVFGKAYNLHKIIYEMHHGDTDSMVDHRNRIKGDNRIDNLRLATKSQNEANTEKRSSNSSGYKGVYWLKNAKKWRAKIDYNKKQIHIGLFSSKHEAAKAYNKKAEELQGEYAFLNVINDDSKADMIRIKGVH